MMGSGHKLAVLSMGLNSSKGYKAAQSLVTSTVK
jgi:hypothetical protein